MTSSVHCAPRRALLTGKANGNAHNPQDLLLLLLLPTVVSLLGGESPPAAQLSHNSGATRSLRVSAAVQALQSPQPSHVRHRSPTWRGRVLVAVAAGLSQLREHQLGRHRALLSCLSSKHQQAATHTGLDLRVRSICPKS